MPKEDEENAGMKRSNGAFLGLLCVSAFGCYSSQIFDPIEYPTAPAGPSTRVILAPLARSADVITEDFEPYFAGVQRGVSRHVAEAGLAHQVVEERHSGSMHEQGERVFLVRYRMTDFWRIEERNGGKTALVSMCASIFLAPVSCWFIGLVPKSRVHTKIVWESVLYEVTGLAPTVGPPNESGERVVSYDTSRLSPLMSREHEIEVGAGLGSMNEREELEFRREMADEMARRLLSMSRDSIVQSIQMALARSLTKPADTDRVR